MLNLMKMDFDVYKYNFVFILFYSVFFGGLFGGAIAAGTIAMLSIYMIVMTGLATEETDKLHLLHKSLPVTVGEIVGTKYIESAIVWIGSMILSTAAIVIAGYVQNKINISFTFSDSIRGSVFMGITLFSVSMIAVSLMIPLIYKFGFSKGRLILSIVWFAFSFGFPPALGSLHFVLTVPYGIICIGSLIIAAAAMVISYFASVKFYRQK